MTGRQRIAFGFLGGVLSVPVLVAGLVLAERWGTSRNRAIVLAARVAERTARERYETNVDHTAHGSASGVEEFRQTLLRIERAGRAS